MRTDMRRCWALRVAQLLLALALVGQQVDGKKKGRRAKGKGKARSAAIAPFDLRASIDGAQPMPALEFRSGGSGAAGRPFLPSMLGVAEEVGTGRFLTEHWGRRACLVRARPGAAPRMLLTVQDLDTIIESHPEAMTSGAGFKFATNGSIVGKHLDGKTVDVDTAHDAYAQGATIVINDIAKLWPALKAHTRTMEDELRIPVSANLYLTPEEERGFNPHYDMDDTFVLQLEGQKEWVVWEAGGWPEGDDRSTSPLRDQRERMHDTPPESVPRYHVMMRPGDVLYIPRGVSHVAATTASSNSLHITFAVHALCWEQFLRLLFAPAGAADPTRAPYQLAHHAWHREAAERLPSVEPLAATQPPLTSRLRARFVKCKASKTGGRREISHGMALQWWLHDVALEQPALRPTFSWHWTESAEGLELGQGTFSALLELLHSRAEGYAQSDGEPEQAEAQLIAKRMKLLGCSAPTAEEHGRLGAVALAVLDAARADGGGAAFEVMSAHARTGFQLLTHYPELPFI